MIDIISRTEMQLVQLLVDSAPQIEKTTEAEFTCETHQLQGPQAPNAALALDDVDNLLPHWGFKVRTISMWPIPASSNTLPRVENPFFK